MMDIDSVVLSSRARIARNLPEYKFSIMGNTEEKSKITRFIKQNTKEFLDKKGYKFFMMRGLNKTIRGLLLEKNLISDEMNQKISGRGIMLDEDLKGPTSIMINEEDHIRIQSISKGFDIDKAFNAATDDERQLEGSLIFAFDEKFGYLTSCPTNVGTGLRLSVIVHLPGLILSVEISEFIKKLNHIGYGLRGFLGEDSEVIGNLFQVYSQKTLGLSEGELLAETKAVVLNTYEEEKNAINKLLKESPKMVEDNIYRSYGMIKYAKLLNFEEAIELVSMIKLGKEIGFLDDVKEFDHYDMLTELGRNHIIDKIKVADNLADEDIETYRADYLREKLLKRI